MSGKRNGSVCRGHELANALYSKVIAASKNDPLKRLSELLTTTDYLTMVMDAKDGQMR